MGFFSRLEARARKIDSLLCIGLDPHPADLPAANADAALHFCLRLIEATADTAVAFKPNAAFFEALGAPGITALAQVIASVPADIPVILDVKRGDIASTADAYAQAAFQTLGAHAVTLSPYLGHDSLTPFLDDPEHGAFLLCKTSNPGSGDLQDLIVLPTGTTTNPDLSEALTLYEVVAQRAQIWNIHDNLGLVAGATHPQALARVRRAAPDLWILAPGIGAQGGDLNAALAAGLRRDGFGLIVPVSRAISRADDPHRAALELRDGLNLARQNWRVTVTPVPAPLPTLLAPPLAALAEGLLAACCVQFGEFKLKSGLISPIYLDLRRLVGFPQLLQQAAAAYGTLLQPLQFDRLAALPYAALPIATAISLQHNWPMVYPRKEVKEYGTRAEVEGVYQSGERAAMIDDLATTGGSKFEAIEKLTAVGLTVTDVVVLIDRQSGASEGLAQAGYKLHAVLTLTQLLDYYEHTNRIPAERIAAVRAFLKT
jgi:uridine monophosphate synthetase